MAKLIFLSVAFALPALALDPDASKVVTFDVASGGTLAALCSTVTGGITALVMYLNQQRKQRVQVSPDPLTVRGLPPSIKEPLCESKHKAVDGQLAKNDKDHDDIFPRLSKIETRLGVLEGTINEIRSEYKSIDDKLTVLLRRPR